MPKRIAKGKLYDPESGELIDFNVPMGDYEHNQWFRDEGTFTLIGCRRITRWTEQARRQEWTEGIRYIPANKPKRSWRNFWGLFEGGN